MAAHRAGAVAHDRADVVEDLPERLAEQVDETGGALDVGHEHGHEPGRQRGPTGPASALALRLQLTGNEADRHDLEPLRSLQQAGPSTVARRLVLELPLAEASQCVPHVPRVVE